MKKLLISSLVFLTSFTLLHAATSINHLPIMSGKDLNEKPWTAPSGLPSTRTLVFVAFEKKQQAGVNSWVEGLELRTANQELPWIELSHINDPGELIRWFINAGMKHRIQDPSFRAHVWMAYTDKKAFMRSCGMTSSKTIYALVVDRNGQIMAMESGHYKMAVVDRLFRALQSP